MGERLFERILLLLAGPDDADRTARALRPDVASVSTPIVAHVIHDNGTGTSVNTGQDQFAQATYKTFVSIFDRSDVSLEWATLKGREVSEALVDAVEIVDATLVVFTPREQDPQRRILTGNPGSKLIRDASVPVMAVPDQTPDQ